MWFKAAKQKRELEERVEKVERAQAALRLDWEETYDKLVKLVQRYTKRAEQIERSDQPEATASARPIGQSTATSHLDPVSAKIIDRRKRYFQPKPESEEEAS